MKHLFGKNRAHIALVLISFLLSACTDPILKSDTWTPTADSSDIVGSYWLPLARFPVTIKRKKCELSLDIAKAEFVPDADHHYNVRFNQDAFATDTVVVQTDDAGLLQSVNASSDPQVVAIIGKVFEIASGVLKMTVAKNTESFVSNIPACDPAKDADLEITRSIDLLSPNATNELNALISDHRIVFKVKAKPAGTSQPGSAAATADCSVGVCYRPVWPYEISISAGEIVTDKNGTPVVSVVQKEIASIIPDSRQLQAVALRRNGPAKTDIKLTFSHGVLTKYDETRPSVALAWIGIPAELLKGILGLPLSSGSAAGPTKK